jgi:hypothetical protein
VQDVLTETFDLVEPSCGRFNKLQLQQGADDKAWLDIDGNQILRANNQWGGIVTGGIGKTIPVSQGVHTLTVSYYDVGGFARVMFDCDSDILHWNA